MEAAGTVEKAIDVLFHLHGSAAAQGVTAIGRSLGLPKSSAHRLLASLSRGGLVEQDAAGRYRPGIGLVALGVGALDREPIVAAARPILEAEAHAIGETVFLVCARAGRLLVLDKAEGPGFLRAAPRVGSAVPAHATAVGKLYLAFAAAALQPSDDLEAFSSSTLTDAAALEAEISAVRARGYATNCNEWIAGMSVVAAPIAASAEGALDGALAVAAPSPRMDSLGLETVARRATAAAARVAARLSGDER